MTLPTALLLIGAFFALLSWNAWRPFYRPSPLAVVSFFAGWPAAEAPFHAFALQLAVLLPVGLAGGFARWPGWVGAALCASGWLFLARQVVRAQRAREALDSELLRLVHAPPPHRACPWWTALVPWPFRPRGVERVRDVVYATVDGRDLKADVFRRVALHQDAREGGAPVLVFVHGGGWIVGSKSEQGLPLLHHLAERGWLCFSIDYRLSPGATFPAHLVDVKRALAFVRERARDFGGDPRCLVIAGNSAGAHLASLAALTPGEPEYQPGFEHADTRVDACVSLYGVYDFVDRGRLWPHRQFRLLLERLVMKLRLLDDEGEFERASPISRVRRDAPSFFVVHGDRDSLVPVAGARAFVRALRAVSDAPVLYADPEGAQHAFDLFPSARTCATIAGVARFCEVVRRAGRHER